MGSVTNESKSSSQSSNDRPSSYAANEAAIRDFSNNRGPYISIVDVLPSHHLCIASTENRKRLLDDTLRTHSARGRGNAQEHTKIKIRKFLLRGLWPFIRNFAPTKISLYTVANIFSINGTCMAKAY